MIKEFEGFLECGIPAYGCLKLACRSCLKEQIVAFSCKKRGFCPSCCAKRQVEAATHLVDHVLPMAPYRQFVVTFPIPMRYWLHSNKALFAKVYRIIIKEIHSYYKTKALTVGIKDPRPGAISFTQLAGSALNLNPHLHILFCDGVFAGGIETFRFRNIEAITDKEVEQLLVEISAKVVKLLKKQGYLNHEGDICTIHLVTVYFKTTNPLPWPLHHSLLVESLLVPMRVRK